MLSTILLLVDEFFDNAPIVVVFSKLFTAGNVIRAKFREEYFHPKVNYEDWLQKYNEIVFFQIFRMKKDTFKKLLDVVLQSDQHCLISKKYRGGNFPMAPEKSILILLWYVAHNDPLVLIADRFGIVPSTVMKIVNVLLYIVCRMKYKYIKWPVKQIDQNHIISGFPSFPGVLGAIDGTHINLKVPIQQQDSYIDRFQRHSINLTAVCTAEKLFTYVFAGFPGSAHDARVLSYTSLYREIETYGKYKFFPTETSHIIGDGAYPLREWLMVPFKGVNLTAKQKYFNFCLSSARVNIENTFGLLKSRWARLKFINTYCVSKAVEISLAACVLHNFCILNHDQWDGEELFEENYIVDFADDDRLQNLLGELKRNNII